MLTIAQKMNELLTARINHFEEELKAIEHERETHYRELLYDEILNELYEIREKLKEFINE